MSNPYHFDKKYQFGKWRVEIDTNANYGYFQHDDSGTEGGLWFERVSTENEQGFVLDLIDFDGRYELPRAIYAGLKALPELYSLDDSFNPDYDITKE